LKARKILERVRRSQNNLYFGDFVKLIEAFGFKLQRSKGSHKTFERQDIDGVLVVQEKKGEAKPYQIKKLLDLVDENNLKLGDE
jgi:predicted RNA binding protein YcfA (HicA-like mRNA interferase family)